MLGRELDIYKSETRWEVRLELQKAKGLDNNTKEKCRLRRRQSPRARQHLEVTEKETEGRLNLWPLKFPTFPNTSTASCGGLVVSRVPDLSWQPRRQTFCDRSPQEWR